MQALFDEVFAGGYPPWASRPDLLAWHGVQRLCQLLTSKNSAP